MVLLYSLIAAELVLVLHVVMYTAGRSSPPSIFIRNEFLLGIVATVAVSLLIGCLYGFGMTAYQWWHHGVQISHLWIIVFSVGITFWILNRLSPRKRLASIAALGDAAAAALPSASELSTSVSPIPTAKNTP
jgi:hypothetical protein